MIIYESEIQDGVNDRLSNNTIAMLCDIKESRVISAKDVQISVAALSGRPIQQDLYYINSILVSSGWNKNGDVFDAVDLITARDTPVDKPLNWMHDSNDIIGHIIASIPVKQNGELIDSSYFDVNESSDEKINEDIDIATTAVLYKSWASEDQTNRVLDIISQIEQDKLSVSMECSFDNFDYAVISPDGSHSVIKRNQESSFLTKHLLAYGGTGDYNGYKIGRLLRNLCFIGKGLVDKPANPRSIIMKTDPFNPTSISQAMEVVMPEDNQLSLAQTRVQELETALATEKSNSIALATEINTHKTSVESLQAKVKELENTIAAVSQEKLALSQELQQIVADAKATARKNSLMSAGATEEKATELLSVFAEATDEMFEKVVALIVKPEVPKEPTKPETNAAAEDLDNVVVDTPTVTVTDEVSDKISQASEFMRSFLKSVPKKGDK